MKPHDCYPKCPAAGEDHGAASPEMTPGVVRCCTRLGCPEVHAASSPSQPAREPGEMLLWEIALRGCVHMARRDEGARPCSEAPESSFHHWCDPCRAVRALSGAATTTLAPWFNEDGSTLMLPADEVGRRRKLAAKVIAAARRACDDLDNYHDVRARTGLDLFDALSALDAAGAASAPRTEGER